MDCSGLSLANYSVPQGGPRLKFVWSARDITLSTTNPFAAKTFSRFSTFSWGYWCRGCSNFSGWWRSFFQFIQICTSKTNITPSYQIFHHTNIYVHAYIYIDIIIYICIYVYIYIYGGFLKGRYPQSSSKSWTMTWWNNRPLTSGAGHEVDRNLARNDGFFWKLPGGMTWWNNRFLLQSVIFCKNQGFTKIVFLGFRAKRGDSSVLKLDLTGKVDRKKSDHHQFWSGISGKHPGGDQDMVDM